MSAPERMTLNGEDFELFLTKKEIKKAVERMADEINRDFAGKKLVVVGVLDGAFMVLSDLLKKLDISVSLELVKLKSYDGVVNTGTVRKLLGLTSSLKGENVLIVEDIIDTGNTLQVLLDLIKGHKPESLAISTLLLKEEIFQNKQPIQYIGFSIPNRFVVGYGMDYDGQGRQLPDIYAKVN